MNPENVIKWLSVVATVATVASATYCMTKYGTTIWWGSAILFLLFAMTYGVSIFWMRRDAYERGEDHERFLQQRTHTIAAEVLEEARRFCSLVKEGTPLTDDACNSFVRLRDKVQTVGPLDYDERLRIVPPEPEIVIAPEIIRHPREDVL